MHIKTTTVVFTVSEEGKRSEGSGGGGDLLTSIISNGSISVDYIIPVKTIK